MEILDELQKQKSNVPGTLALRVTIPDGNGTSVESVSVEAALRTDFTKAGAKWEEMESWKKKELRSMSKQFQFLQRIPRSMYDVVLVGLAPSKQYFIPAPQLRMRTAARRI